VAQLWEFNRLRGKQAMPLAFHLFAPLITRKWALLLVARFREIKKLRKAGKVTHFSHLFGDWLHRQRALWLVARFIKFKHLAGLATQFLGSKERENIYKSFFAKMRFSSLSGTDVPLMLAAWMRFWLLPSRVSCMLLCPSLLLLLLLYCILLLLVDLSQVMWGPTRHLGSLTAANWVSFDFIVSYSSCWG